MATHQLADPSMNIPDMLQKAIRARIKRPSFGQKGQGKGRIFLFIKLPRLHFDLKLFFFLGFDRSFLLEILFKVSIAFISLSRLMTSLPSIEM